MSKRNGVAGIPGNSAPRTPKTKKIPAVVNRTIFLNPVARLGEDKEIPNKCKPSGVKLNSYYKPIFNS